MTATPAPSSPSRRAMAAPIPVPPPVTSATRPPCLRCVMPDCNGDSVIDASANAHLASNCSHSARSLTGLQGAKEPQPPPTTKARLRSPRKPHRIPPLDVYESYVDRARLSWRAEHARRQVKLDARDDRRRSGSLAQRSAGPNGEAPVQSCAHGTPRPRERVRHGRRSEPPRRGRVCSAQMRAYSYRVDWLRVWTACSLQYVSTNSPSFTSSGTAAGHGELTPKRLTRFGTRPRDLRSSVVMLPVHEGIPLGRSRARWVGPSG